MPLQTAIVRNGQPLRLRWGWWHVQVMAEQSALDTGVTYDPCRMFDAPVFSGPHTVTTERTFQDPSDGEVLTFLPGDVLQASR